MKTDLEPRQDVERELSWNPKIDANKITVTSKNGVVTLGGQVRHFFEKWEAEDSVKRVIGVTGIADDMEVTLGGAKPDDTDLAQRVINALDWNAAVPKNKVKPVVRVGWVTLTGLVDWNFEKKAAENAVRYLHGVMGVTNSITIDAMATQGDVSGNITEALTRNARIDAQQITVMAHGHTVTLDGPVRSWAERDEAEMAAWSPQGVDSVENHLRIQY